MPISRAAAEIEPVRAMAASRSALPGPIAITAPIRMRIFGTSGLRIESARRTPFAQETGSQYRSEEHTSELQSHSDLVCRLLLEKKKKKSACSIRQHRTEP